MSSAHFRRRDWSVDEAREYASLLDLANDAILVMDLGGTIQFWNQGCDRLYGWRAGDALGRNAHQLLKTQFPVPLDEIRQWLRREREWTGELVHTTHEGREVTVSSRWTPRYNRAGELIGTFEINRDITHERAAREALMAAEERFQLAHAAAKAWWWQYDLASHTLSRSRDVSEIYGLATGSVSPHDFEAAREMVHPDDQRKLDEMLRMAARGEQEAETEFRIVLPDGSVRWVLSRGRIISQLGKKIVVGIAVDITERKQAEDVRRRTEQLATLGRLAATVAHEINNPLETVNSILHLLRKEASPENCKLIDSGQGEVRSIAEITSATLRFARETPKAAEVSLREIVDAVLAVFSGRLRSRGITVKTRFTADGKMHAVAGEIRQVIANLVANAADAMEHGGTLQIHLHPARRGDREGFRLTISDSGPGIPKALWRRIFEPFFTTKGESGTGLGLLVVRDVVAKSGGTLRLRSSIGRDRHGTCFSIFLPAQQ